MDLLWRLFLSRLFVMREFRFKAIQNVAHLAIVGVQTLGKTEQGVLFSSQSLFLLYTLCNSFGPDWEYLSGMAG